METKTYKIKIDNDGRNPRIEEGTLEQLHERFSYTIEVGVSWNRKLKKQCKTIAQFVSNLQKCFEEKEASCYRRTIITRADDIKLLTDAFAIADALAGDVSGNYRDDLSRLEKMNLFCTEHDYSGAYQLQQQA